MEDDFFDRRLGLSFLVIPNQLLDPADSPPLNEGDFEVWNSPALGVTDSELTYFCDTQIENMSFQELGFVETLAPVQWNKSKVLFYSNDLL